MRPVTPASDMSRRRSLAVSLAATAAGEARIGAAPEAFVAQLSAAEIARACSALDSLPAPGRVTVAVAAAARLGQWHVDVVGHDRPRLLAAIAGSLADAGLDVDRAAMAAWDDGAVLDTFVVRSPSRPDATDLAELMSDRLNRPLNAPGLRAARLHFAPGERSTVCDVRAPDRRGVLHAITAAFAAAEAEVQAARVTTVVGHAVNRFQLTDRHGASLDRARQQRIRACVRLGVTGGAPTRTHRLLR